MINATEVHHVYEEESPSGYWPVVKRQVGKAPLTALGVAAGAGLLAYHLLRPKPTRRQDLIGKAAKAIGGRGMRSRAGRSIKSVIGSLALAYLNRKVNSKLRWR